MYKFHLDLKNRRLDIKVNELMCKFSADIKNWYGKLDILSHLDEPIEVSFVSTRRNSDKSEKINISILSGCCL